jgi:hypothetical protein
MDELPIYESKRTAAGLWQRYLVFRDRVELRTLFGRFRLPFESIVSIDVSPPLLKVMARGQMSKELRAIKLDCADLVEHVCVQSSRGVIRYYRFTPDDPKEFAYSAISAWERFPKIKAQTT